MKMALSLLTLLFAGPGLLAIGVHSSRAAAWRESVSLFEWLIDRAAGLEPQPRTAWDRRFALVESWLLVVFGSFFSLAFVAIIFSLFA